MKSPRTELAVGQHRGNVSGPDLWAGSQAAGPRWGQGRTRGRRTPKLLRGIWLSLFTYLFPWLPRWAGVQGAGRTERPSAEELT